MLPTTASLTRQAERSLSKAEAMYLVLRVAKALLRGFGCLRRHKVFARLVSSSHLATLSQTSPLTSTIMTKRVRGGYKRSHKLCSSRLRQCVMLEQTECSETIYVRATSAEKERLRREVSERGLGLLEYLQLNLLG